MEIQVLAPTTPISLFHILSHAHQLLLNGGKGTWDVHTQRSFRPSSAGPVPCCLVGCSGLLTIGRRYEAASFNCSSYNTDRVISLSQVLPWGGSWEKALEAVQTEPRVSSLVPSTMLSQLSPTCLLIPRWHRHMFRPFAWLSAITKDTTVNHCCEKSGPVSSVTDPGAFAPLRPEA